MQVQPVVFASPVYYTPTELAHDAAILLKQIGNFLPSNGELLPPVVLFDQKEVDAYLAEGRQASPLLVAMSGATQKWVLSVAKAARQSLLWWYFPGDELFGAEVEKAIGRIVSKNALPAVMDCWAHLKNRDVCVERVFDQDSFQAKYKQLSALRQIRSTRLLIIGYTQQWVVSTSVNERWIEEKLGIQTVHIGLEELFAEFHSTLRGPEVDLFVKEYLEQAAACLEPNRSQIEDAYVLYLALRRLLDRYNANALAISCFSLVKQLGVTSCLALSLLNDDAECSAACEGDLDAAVSMIVGKALTGKPVFMGNPVYHRDNTLDLVHCTAPRRLTGDEGISYTVRSHHETGVSVAQRIELNKTGKATIFRIGNEFNEATLFLADFYLNPDEDTCRTQFRFRIDSTEKRINEALGCHHMVIFEDCVEEMRTLLTGSLRIRIR